MKKTITMRKTVLLLITVCLILGLLPISAQTADYGTITFRATSGDTLTESMVNEQLSAAGVGGPDTFSAEFDSSVMHIGDYAFYYRSGLTSAVIPGSVKSIGDYAFNYCPGLTDVVIPDSISSIGDYTFAVSGLINVVIPDSVKSIGKGAFWMCTNLTDVVIPNSVEDIFGGAFYNCISLTSVDIPGSVTNIGEIAFSMCSSLTEINVSIANSAYSSYDGMLFNKNQTMLHTCPAGKSGVCTILGSVSFISAYAFSGCYKLTAFDVISANSNYSSHEGVLYNKNQTTLIIYPANKYGDYFTIPNSVTSISSDAFFACSRLANIVIPGSVTRIGDRVFYWCTNLTGIVIPDGVTIIGEESFFMCVNLTSVVIPDSVKSIGDSAFYGCISLTSVSIPDSVTSIGDYVFFECSSLTGVVIPDNVTSIGDCAFRCCSELTYVVISESVASIGDMAFEGCPKLSSICFEGDEPSAIGVGAFDDIAPGAITYVYPSALGFPPEYELWNGMIVKYLEATPFSVNVQSRGSKGIKLDGRNTFEVSFLLRANKVNKIIQNTQGLRLAYDNTLLQLVRWDASSAIAEPIAGEPFVLADSACGNAGVLGDTVQVYSAKSQSGNTGFLSLSLSNPAATYECPIGEYEILGQVRFAFRPGKDADDLVEDSIRIMEPGELNDLKQNCAVIINDEKGTMYTYGWQQGGVAIPTADSINKPTFTWVVRTGVDVTGIVKSYNPKNETTVALKQGNVEKYSTIINATTQNGQVEQEFTIEYVAPGTYDLVISKQCHTDFIVQKVIVGKEDVDLTQDSRPEVRLMTLRCGDISGDGLINDVDLSYLWMLANYNKNTNNAVNPQCDLNGDGMINDMDLTILWMAYNYNRGDVIIPEAPTDPQLAFVVSFDTYFAQDGDKHVQLYEATIVDLNGVVRTVPTTANMYSGRGGPYIGRVCSYVITQNEYIFVALSDTLPTADDDGTYIVEPRVEEIRNMDTRLYPNTGLYPPLAVNRANMLTKFVVVNFDNDGEPDGTVTVTTGISAVKNYGTPEEPLECTYAVSYNAYGYTNSIADIVYIFDQSASQERLKLVYVSGSYYEDSDGFHISVIVDGKIDEIVASDLKFRVYSGELIYEVRLINGKLIADADVKPVPLGSDEFTSIKIEYLDGFMYISELHSLFEIADDAPVYIISVPEGKPEYATVQSVTAAYFASIRAYENANYYCSIEDGEVTALYIIENTYSA